MAASCGAAGARAGWRARVGGARAARGAGLEAAGLGGPAAVEREDLGEAVVVVVVVQDADAGLLGGGGDQRVGRRNPVLQRTAVGERTQRADGGTLDRDGDR